jgi:hypothetical protein
MPVITNCDEVSCDLKLFDFTGKQSRKIYTNRDPRAVCGPPDFPVLPGSEFH